jgi:hypothetical protein
MLVYAYLRVQREVAAFRAISARFSGVIFAARAFPPFLPMAAAAGSLPNANLNHDDILSALLIHYEHRKLFAPCPTL